MCVPFSLFSTSYSSLIHPMNFPLPVSRPHSLCLSLSISPNFLVPFLVPPYSSMYMYMYMYIPLAIKSVFMVMSPYVSHDDSFMPEDTYEVCRKKTV